MDKHSGTLECLSTARATQKIFCNSVLTKGLLGDIMITETKRKEKKKCGLVMCAGAICPINGILAPLAIPLMEV